MEDKRMKTDLATTYDPRQFEERLTKTWLEAGYFTPTVDPDKKPYTIVMPPPNITGKLHMGHALDNALQDILIRFRRMQGYSTLWLPGQDHASIATEVKVENELLAKGIWKSSGVLGPECFDPDPYIELADQYDFYMGIMEMDSPYKSRKNKEELLGISGKK